MIEKIIHYCWFGRAPLPEMAIMCINSWKKCLPEYEIKEWNEDNFDVNMIPYTKEAYKEKKYAFVSDFARFWVLYKYGGVYFDTDVEVIKPINDILARGAFMGIENLLSPNSGAIPNVAPGLGMAVEANNPFCKEIIQMYKNTHYINQDGSKNEITIVKYTTDLLVSRGLRNVQGIQQVGNIYIYPKEYFCPLDYGVMRLNLTENTRTIHHYSASWKSPVHQYVLNKLRQKSILPITFRRHILYVYAYAKYEGIAVAFKEIISKIKK